MRFCSSIFAKCILLFSSLRNSKTYLPKLSIPVERRELGDGWVLTCHGQNGGDLTLSDVKIKRKNIVCQVLGGDSLFLPLFDAIDDTDKSVAGSVGSLTSAGGAPEDHEEIEHMEQSILDHIKDMIPPVFLTDFWSLSLQHPTDPYMNSVLHGLPVTSIVNCAIELWRNLELSDDELLEVSLLFRDTIYYQVLKRA